jgi:hypothetical protein
MSRMIRSNRLWNTVAGCAVIAALAFGTFALFTEANAAPRCLCPKVYAPVTCDNGKTYPNLCVANCKNAKNCVPVIVLPPPR